MTAERFASRVEEACLNGWPSLSSVLFEGWLLRFAEGHTKRANSINVIAPARPDGRAALAGRIGACEALYAARGLPTIFRLSSAVPHEGLADALDAAGFGPPQDETRVLVAERLPASLSPGAPVRLSDTPERSWIESFARISGLDARGSDLHGRILAALALPAVFAAVEAPDGTTGAVAFGAVHDRLVCLNSVATAPAHRGRGLGSRAVSAILVWAAARAGAEAACLPVGAANEPALALYRRCGFATEISRYHYRVADRRREDEGCRAAD